MIDDFTTQANSLMNKRFCTYRSLFCQGKILHNSRYICPQQDKNNEEGKEKNKD
jgi:hypothetical protein